MRMACAGHLTRDMASKRAPSRRPPARAATGACYNVPDFAARDGDHHDGKHDRRRFALSRPRLPRRRARDERAPHLGGDLALRRHDGGGDRRRPAVRLDRAGRRRPAHVHACQRAAARRARLYLCAPARRRSALHLRHRQARRPRRLHQRDHPGDDRAADRLRGGHAPVLARCRSISPRRSRSPSSASSSTSPAPGC